MGLDIGEPWFASVPLHRGVPQLQSLICVGLSVSADPWGHNTSLTARLVGHLPFTERLPCAVNRAECFPGVFKICSLTTPCNRYRF